MGSVYFFSPKFPILSPSAPFLLHSSHLASSITVFTMTALLPVCPVFFCFFFPHTIRALSHLWPPQLQSHKILITPSSPHQIRRSHAPVFSFFCTLSLVTLSEHTFASFCRQPILWSCLWCHTSLVIVRSACFLNLYFILSVYLS